MNLSTDEINMFRLAQIVCKDRLEIRQSKDGVVMLEGYYSHATGVPDKWVKPEVFNPFLTGEDWQVAQACRVIVAAENSPQHQQYRDHVANGMPSFQAAISALLGKEGV